MSSTQTMKNWAIKIADIAELPKHFQPDAKELLKYYPEEPSIIYAPSKDHNDAVLILLEQEVAVLEKQDHESVVVRFPLEDLQYIQMGSVLLDSWLKFCGKTARGYRCETVYFNTVMDALFEPVMETIRRKMLHIEGNEAPIENEKLDQLKDTNLKFFNYGTMSLLPGQKVLASAFQPEVKLSFWQRSSGRQTEPHLLMLTQEELVMIKEQSHKKKSATQKYSGIWTHIPLQQINTIELAPLDGGWGEMTIQMEGQENLQLFYESEYMEKAHHLIETLIAQKRMG